jgi:predicted trehalose synthase
MRKYAIVLVFLSAACAAISQQKAQTPVADNLEFHNLQVLPANITHDELIATMRGFARGLGTRCNHCHVTNPPGSKEEFDFASDAKPEKKVARTMLRMARDINANYISKVNAHGQTVTCLTCHRGKTVPDTQGPPAAQAQPQPPPQPQP